MAQAPAKSRLAAKSRLVVKASAAAVLLLHPPPHHLTITSVASEAGMASEEVGGVVKIVTSLSNLQIMILVQHAVPILLKIGLPRLIQACELLKTLTVVLM